MPVRRIQQKFASWRREPEHVRVRIASLLTAGSGVALTLLWLVVLLPLQLRLGRPDSSDDVTKAVGEVARGRDDAAPQGAVGGAQDRAIFEPTPNPADATLYHGTRPTRRRSDIFILASPTPSATTVVSPTPSPTSSPVSTPSDTIVPSAPVEITE